MASKTAGMQVHRKNTLILRVHSNTANSILHYLFGIRTYAFSSKLNKNGKLEVEPGKAGYGYDRQPETRISVPKCQITTSPDCQASIQLCSTEYIMNDGHIDGVIIIQSLVIMCGSFGHLKKKKNCI